MINLRIIRERIYRKTLNYRAMERLVNTPTFEQLFNHYGDTDKEKVLDYVDKGDIDELKLWMKKKIDDEIGGRSMRELRQIAAGMYIRSYSLMSKGELISAIINNDPKNGDVL